MPNIRKKKKICKMKGCNKLEHSRGYCLAHYVSLIKSGKLKKIEVECGLCTKESYRKGFCKEHYKQLRKFEDDYSVILVDDMIRKRDLKRYGECVEEDCTEPALSSKTKLCRRHYYCRYRKLRKENGDKPFFSKYKKIKIIDKKEVTIC